MHQVKKPCGLSPATCPLYPQTKVWPFFTLSIYSLSLSPVSSVCPSYNLSLSLSLYSISSFLLPFLSAPSLLSFSSFLHSASLPKFFQLSYILISLYLSLFLIPASFTPSMLYFFPFIPDFIFHLDFSLFPLFPILYLHSSWPHLYTLNTSSAPLSSRGYSNIITTNILSTITIASTRYPP